MGLLYLIQGDYSQDGRRSPLTKDHFGFFINEPLRMLSHVHDTILGRVEYVKNST
jgi:hypothetical protein